MSAGTGHVAVIGGGLAGMSASVARAGVGYRITLIEKRPSLGGRAGSQLDAATGEWIDNCQHVPMPCCTNLLDFYRRIKIENRVGLKARVLKEPMATFSLDPASEVLRPSTATGIPNLFLGGDWIQTGWPSTMEGAVRAGYIAASAVVAADGRTQSFLVPDPPPSGLMRLWRAPA